MANTEEAANSAAEKKQIKEERKKLKQEEKRQKQEIKKRAKEISKREAALDDENEGGGVSAFLVTTVIVLVWIAILCLLIKLDVGGFGSGILKPILQDVPVVKWILPGDNVTETGTDGTYGGYSSLKEAVDYLKVLELELEHEQSVNKTNEDEINRLNDEIARLSEFESRMVEFEREYRQFYEEVIYSEKGPGAAEYKKYFESIDPTTAAALYKQVVLQLEEDAKFENYVKTYSSMKPKQAAAQFNIADDLNLVAKILTALDADTRGAILGAMDTDVAWKITKIMNPED